ncbi:Uncharacterised protein [Escherichia coli]|nr:Uncharacterised protein [Escherichia coli]SQR25411.1 Uncharacterised protein [Escherichia coli]SQR42926.1 Uncharacterised protein [Escherichia coli]SQR45709.1 Uncharacterised protein [Escherichia coli]SQR79950.1 Uncharacterised protein [Escherichia coli]
MPVNTKQMQGLLVRLTSPFQVQYVTPLVKSTMVMTLLWIFLFQNSQILKMETYQKWYLYQFPVPIIQELQV